MEIVFFLLIPLGLVAYNAWEEWLSHRQTMELEEFNRRVALEIEDVRRVARLDQERLRLEVGETLRARQEEDRRAHHERQLSELKALAETKRKELASSSAAPAASRKPLPEVSFKDSVAQPVPPRVTVGVTQTARPEVLALADVFVDEDREDHF